MGGQHRDLETSESEEQSQTEARSGILPEKMRMVRVPERKLGWWAIWEGMGVVERDGMGTGVSERGEPRSLFSEINRVRRGVVYV